MARAQTSDFLHSMRFHVTTDFSDTSLNIDSFGSNAPAGFMSVTTPELTTEAVEYREGTFNYARKFPGNSTVSDVTLQKGVVYGYTNFWAWLRIVVEGTGDYRCNMTIKHYNRAVLSNPPPKPADSGVSLAKASAASTNDAAGNTVPARSYILYEAFAIRHKVAADLDASSSDISVAELDVAFEYFDVIEPEANPNTGKTRSTSAASANPPAG